MEAVALVAAERRPGGADRQSWRCRLRRIAADGNARRRRFGVPRKEGEERVV